ncbi:MAG TPA: MTH938/NDUFAF3 family protein [Micromonospora sp.]
MSGTGRSPRIVDVSWGRIEVADLGTMKDAKLWPGGGREWDWTETGTGHQPGISVDDVRELLDHGATTIVLARGLDQRLQVAPATLELLAGLSVEVHVAETRQAVAVYNELAETTAVGGLFHSTC